MEGERWPLPRSVQVVKIALYTIFRCTNYGAVLQAYALARILRDILGEDAVDVINHRMDPRDNHLLGKITNPNTPWFQRWRNKRKFAARYFHPELFERRRLKTIRLIDNFIRPTGKLYKDPKELRGLSPSGNGGLSPSGNGGLSPYDTVVVGSDQIWNPSLNHDFGHNQYLGTDLPDKQDRVAYAASFGVSELPEECRDEYRAALSKFRIITVREESGARICRSLIPSNGDSPQGVADGDSPQVVLDPTLLLTADDWRMVVGTVPEGQRGTVPDRAMGTVPKGASGRYVAAYWVRTLTEADVAALGRIARDMATPICLMSAGPLPKFRYPSEVAPYIDADPFDFVRTLSGATAVVTDSFHGLQFATLFEKRFLALGNISDPKSNASRLVDFCARYGLSGGIQDIEAFRAGTAHPLADVARFDAKALAADRSHSRDALKGMLP